MTTIVINGNPISFGDVGKGPAVLLLAGWNEDHRMFKQVVPALARRYRVLTLDWRARPTFSVSNPSRARPATRKST